MAQIYALFREKMHKTKVFLRKSEKVHFVINRTEILEIYLTYMINMIKSSITIETFIIFVAGLKHN